MLAPGGRWAPKGELSTYGITSPLPRSEDPLISPKIFFYEDQRYWLSYHLCLSLRSSSEKSVFTPSVPPLGTTSPLGVNSVPGGQTSTLGAKLQPWGPNFNLGVNLGTTSLLGDNFSPWGQLLPWGTTSPLGAKLHSWGSTWGQLRS
jgi:hypothetical protein